MSFMSTIRLTVTPELKEQLDLLRYAYYPALSDAEIAKVTIGVQAVRARRPKRKILDLDYSDPTPKELMRHAEYIFSLDEGDQYDEPFWDETKIKPVKIKNHV